MSIMPLPKRDIFGGTSTSRGSCGFSNFTRHDVPLVNLVFMSDSILHLRRDSRECLGLAEEAYACNAMRPRIQAKREIVHGHAAEREHREIIEFASNIRKRLNSNRRPVFPFRRCIKHRTKDNEISSRLSC